MGNYLGAKLPGPYGIISSARFCKERPAGHSQARRIFVQTLILTLYIIVCVLLIILVLLQSGKEGMGVIFGGGSSSVFGSSGAGGILAKLTAFMAVVFVITAISYTYVTSSRPASESTILDVRIEEPAKPAPSPEQLPQSKKSVEPPAASAQGQQDDVKQDVQDPAARPQEGQGEAPH